MYGSVKDEIAETLREIEEAGLYKRERELTSPQAAHVTTLKAEALNFCANNYLGLADDPVVVEAAKKALDEWGFGMASVRFICGTQTQHTRLEATISEFLGTRGDDPLLLVLRRQRRSLRGALRAEDAIISDELNHASIIDGVRLSKAMRYRYKNADMTDLRAQLEAAARLVPGAPSSSPTASSRWTAPTPRSTRSVTWPTSSARSSSSTTRTRWASSATAAAAPPSSSA